MRSIVKANVQNNHYLINEIGIVWTKKVNEEVSNEVNALMNIGYRLRLIINEK